MKATGALASLDSDFLLPYATHLVRSTASTSSSNCLEWSTRCLISMTRRGSLTAALTYLSKCSVKLDGMPAPRSATSCCLTRSRSRPRLPSRSRRKRRPPLECCHLQLRSLRHYPCDEDKPMTEV